VRNAGILEVGVGIGIGIESGLFKLVSPFAPVSIDPDSNPDSDAFTSQAYAKYSRNNCTPEWFSLLPSHGHGPLHQNRKNLASCFQCSYLACENLTIFPSMHSNAEFFNSVV
jgi:hypothetical protein